MNAQIVHRGPDDDGFFVNGRVGLAMRRLSIIDLSGGHQPIANEDESCTIVFNGEIYNYRELRQRLLAHGHSFRTASDTEVILHQYEESGLDCVHHLNGMFGFAIWDGRARRLLLARDRMGIKPLYYSWDGRRLIFGSEIKSILASDQVPREVDPESLWHYLTFRYVPAPGTIWKGIRKLPPGHLLTLDVDAGEPQIRRYWDIRYAPDPVAATPEEDLEQFSSLFLGAVERRLIADVPVGILLSGGLDSSAVAAAVREVHSGTVSTFSVAFREGGEFSELSHARRVARHLGTDHHEVEIDHRDFMEFLPELVWYTDEPLADGAAIPLHFVSRLAVQTVKVVLSGEGADEVLGGYDFDQAVRQWQRVARFQRLPRVLRERVPRAILGAVGSTGTIARLERGNLPLRERNLSYLPFITNFFSAEEKRALWPDAPALPQSEELLRGYYRRSGSPDPLHQMLYAYCQDWLTEDLLMKADKMTMANSLELRVPFLDFRLVEWLATRPAELKVGRDERGRLRTKRLLRQFAQSRIPDTILERPKQGFPVPIGPWLAGPLAPYARDLLLSRDSRLPGWFDPAELRRVVERGTQSGAATQATERVWLLVVLELWARRWL